MKIQQSGRTMCLRDGESVEVGHEAELLLTLFSVRQSTSQSRSVEVGPLMLRYVYIVAVALIVTVSAEWSAVE